ncbi:uncharacterized protein LOC135086588 [Ostrinia nubilalis]|uniref:uncharacterized protein LOC114353147 n=1 Tax=Ostrinia furnacalis TaxID=93504 RepID=UPI00103F2A5F|nr:uncharacterized protein LOC114353147 [Ostrinia furnacalis]
MEKSETNDDVQQNQDDNTTSLVMNTFYKVANDAGVTAEDITKYLVGKFGDVWQVSTLTSKAEEALKRKAADGLLEQQGDRFIAALARETGCGKRRRRRSCGRVRKRRRRSCRRKRKKKPCCCKKN